MVEMKDANSGRSETEASSSDGLQVYLKVIEYKRSIGVTQWTVLSIFTTASGAVFSLALNGEPSHHSRWLYVFAVMVYWFGFSLYMRYRSFNREVSRYLVELERQLGLGFQTHLERRFHDMPGMSTKWILCVAGILYTGFGLVLLVW